MVQYHTAHKDTHIFIVYAIALLKVRRNKQRQGIIKSNVFMDKSVLNVSPIQCFMYLKMSCVFGQEITLTNYLTFARHEYNGYKETKISCLHQVSI